MKKHGGNVFQKIMDKEEMPIVRKVVNANETVWNVNQLAEILDLSKWAVLKRIQRGTIPAHKDGKKWYILKSEFIERLRNI